ncbi:hypothetical protein F4801DRAFT_603353 [Xylaria longipes]|nr:hypothetical protein F4801DRAFT_603353 [Xylaria longipes]
MVPDLLGMTIEDLVGLNPWIGSNCDAGIWSHLNCEDYVQLCVESGTTGPSTTQAPPSSTTPSGTPTATAVGVSQTNTQSQQMNSRGAIREWALTVVHSGLATLFAWVVSGDACWDISNDYGITLDEFYRLNPNSKHLAAEESDWVLLTDAYLHIRPASPLHSPLTTTESHHPLRVALRTPSALPITCPPEFRCADNWTSCCMIPVRENRRENRYTTAAAAASSSLLWMGVVQTSVTGCMPVPVPVACS